MEWLSENWVIVICALCMIGALVYSIYYFFNLPTEQQIANLKEWLKWAVTEAEKELGSGTGQLKLHMVYDMAVSKFPWIVNLISFSTFSMWVDEALEWMKKQLESNQAINNLVNGEDN